MKKLADYTLEERLHDLIRAAQGKGFIFLERLGCEVVNFGRPETDFKVSVMVMLNQWDVRMSGFMASGRNILCEGHARGDAESAASWFLSEFEDKHARCETSCGQTWKDQNMPGEHCTCGQYWPCTSWEQIQRIQKAKNP